MNASVPHAGAAAILRSATAAAHDRVDQRFSRFDLTDGTDYRAFLTAQARALPAAEAYIDRFAGLPDWQRRTPLLAQDLADLGVDMPETLDFDLPADNAARWGVFYVLEGSRLGGAMLARAVPGDWPVAFLGATHGSGGWRAVRAAIDHAARVGDPDWTERAVVAAKACFGLYERALDANAQR